MGSPDRFFVKLHGRAATNIFHAIVAICGIVSIITFGIVYMIFINMYASYSETNPLCEPDESNCEADSMVWDVLGLVPFLIMFWALLLMYWWLRGLPPKEVKN